MTRVELVKKLSNEIHATDVELYPHAMPRQPYLAAEWFLGLVRGSGTSGAGVFHMLKIFMNADREFQNLVIEAAADGIPWRGDVYDEFQIIISETRKMQPMGMATYKKQVLQDLRTIGVNL